MTGNNFYSFTLTYKGIGIHRVYAQGSMAHEAKDLKDAVDKFKEYAIAEGEKNGKS